MDKSKEPIEKCNSKKSTKPWKSVFRAFIIGCIITFCIKPYQAMVDTDNKTWAEYQSIYDTKDEYFKLNKISRLRCYLAENGFNETHPIQKFLTSYSEKILLQAKAKIPEGDIAIGDFIFMHKYDPLMRSKSAIITDYDKQELLNFAKNLMEKKSQMESFNKVHRFYLSIIIVSWFLNEAPNDVTWDMGDQLNYISDKIIAEIKIPTFLQQSSILYYMPISIAFDRLKLTVAYYNVYGCDNRTLNKIREDIKNSDMLVALYTTRTPVEHGRQLFLKNIETYSEMRKALQKDLLEKCNCKIGRYDDK